MIAKFLLPCYYCWCIKFSCSRATRNRNDPSKVSVLISIMTPSALPESIALDQSDYSIDQTPQIYRKEENEKIDSFYEESKKHEKPEKKGTIFLWLPGTRIAPNDSLKIMHHNAQKSQIFLLGAQDASCKKLPIVQ